MTDLDLGALALGWIAAYGAPMLAAILMLSAAGVPLPATLLVIASGAFVRQALLDLYLTPLLGLAGTVAGDVALYGLGRLASPWIERRFGGTEAWRQARGLFERRGGLAIFLTRWLLTALAFPVTLVAGSSRYRFRRFFALALAGEATWLGLYGSLGYVLGTQWELLSDFAADFSGFAVGAVAVGLGVYLLVRYRRAPVAPGQPD